MDARRVRLRLALVTAATWAALLAAPAAAQAPGSPAPGAIAQVGSTDLTARYTLGDRCEVDARMDLLLKIRLVCEVAHIDRTSEQAQVVVRRYRDELKEVKDGKVAEVERRFAEAWDGLREPGAQALEREQSPLHHRRILIGLDAEGRRRVRPAAEPPIPTEALEDELHTERWEAILPKDPVASGAGWKLEGEAMARALGKGLGAAPEGKITCRFAGVKEAALDEGGPVERLAVIEVTVDARGKQGEEEDAPTFSATLRGEVLFDLARRKVAKVDLTGEARLRQTRKDGDAVVEIDGRGPLTIAKRTWFPERPKKGDAPPEPREDEGLGPPPGKPDPGKGDGLAPPR